MIPPATAMTKTGAATLIGNYVVSALGSAGSLAVLAGIFLVSAVITQFISNTSSALVMMPIGLATGFRVRRFCASPDAGCCYGRQRIVSNAFCKRGKLDGVWAGRISVWGFLETRSRCHGLGVDRHSSRDSSILEILKGVEQPQLRVRLPVREIILAAHDRFTRTQPNLRRSGT